MQFFDLRRRLAAEWLGTAALAATVVGSGIMAQGLTHDIALALLANTLATAAMLVVLITLLGPISGAHFNPAVSAIMAITKDLGRREAFYYMVAQISGGMIGTLTAHLMFGLEILQISHHARNGFAQYFSEAIASFGLIATILAGVRFQRAALAWLVGLYITAAYWFTASTSFANPAIAIARGITNSFCGIRPIDVPGFITAELTGAIAALLVIGWMLRPGHSNTTRITAQASQNPPAQSQATPA